MRTGFFGALSSKLAVTHLYRNAPFPHLLASWNSIFGPGISCCRSGSQRIFGNDPSAQSVTTKPPLTADSNGQKYFKNDSTSDYVAGYLHEMNEPSLQGEPDKEIEQVYRFTYSPSFHGPIMVRLVKKNGHFEGRAVATKREEVNSYESKRTIVSDLPLTFDPATSAKLDELLNPPDFFKPLTDSEQGLSGTDGSDWTFEKRDHTDYKLIEVWSPNAIHLTSDELKRAGLDPAQIRDFAIYRTVGIALMKFAGVYPIDFELY